jgi:pSer/pThr/pTyr-binding forkhead associated (FHA) protein
MDEATQLTEPRGARLRVTQGPDAGDVFELDREGEYRIGRSAECEIPIANDMAASRLHALLRVTKDGCQVLDQGSGNGIFVNAARVQESALLPNDLLRVGENILVLETADVASEDSTLYIAPPKEAAAPAVSPSRRRLYALAGCLVLALGFLAFAVTRNRGTEPQTPQTPSAAQPAAPTPPAPLAPPVAQAPAPPAAPLASPTLTTPQAPDMTATPYAPPAQPETAATPSMNAEELFQHGMFFYRAGNLKRAADVWSEALAKEPGNENFQKWLQRAERELDQEIDKHHRQGLIAKKYMRKDEAKHELTLVIELSRDKNDERYLTTLKLLEELARE